MRTNLKVPFAEKDEAKGLGARWDPARKVWFVENKADLSPFAKWIPDANAAAAGNGTSSKRPSATKDESRGITIVGSNYVNVPRVCDCLPWDVCDKCRSTAFNLG